MNMVLDKVVHGKQYFQFSNINMVSHKLLLGKQYFLCQVYLLEQMRIFLIVWTETSHIHVYRGKNNADRSSMSNSHYETKNLNHNIDSVR